MNKDDYITTEQYLDLCKETLNSYKDILQNPLLNKNALDIILITKFTHDTAKEIFELSEKERQKNE